MTNKLSSRPPGRRAGDSGVDDFISGAGTQTNEEADATAEQATTDYPWEAPAVRDDMIKVYNLRLPETHLLKLKYIAEHTPYSMQKFCLDVLLPAIDLKIEELTRDR